MLFLVKQTREVYQYSETYSYSKADLVQAEDIQQVLLEGILAFLLKQQRLSIDAGYPCQVEQTRAISKTGTGFTLALEDCFIGGNLTDYFFNIQAVSEENSMPLERYITNLNSEEF